MSRLPLKTVAFNQPTAIPGCTVMLTTVTPMEQRLPGGDAFVCPQPYLNTDRGCVEIEDRCYPLSRVHFYEIAPAAKSKPEPAPDLERYTVGRRPPRRTVIAVTEVKDLGPVIKKSQN